MSRQSRETHGHHHHENRLSQKRSFATQHPFISGDDPVCIAVFGILATEAGLNVFGKRSPFRSWVIAGRCAVLQRCNDAEHAADGRCVLALRWR